MLQIRIAEFDGSDPIILEMAKDRRYAKSINSADEGVSFTIAKNSPKADVLNPDVDGYKKRWEVWDTEQNRRLNWGPITEISENGPDWKVTGSGRSALLNDFKKSQKTFYASIDTILDGVRYENLAAQPRTVTLVPIAFTSAAQEEVFGEDVDIDEKYYSLSNKTKDFAIDDDTGELKPGEIEPSNTFYATDRYWSGMSRKDSHITDLGDIYPVHKINLALPSWGGPARKYNRSYDYRISFATDEGSTTTLRDREFGTFTTLYTSDIPNYALGGITLWVGYNSSGNLDYNTEYEYFQPIYARYIRVEILNTHAWYGTHFDNEVSVDGWAHQCDPDYVTGSIASISTPGLMNQEINTRQLEAANNCHASIKEIAINKEIIGLDQIKPLALQRIDNNNFQITYSHTPDSSETETTENGFRKFEPGGFFRKVTFSYSGANTTRTKFYESDCSNCYVDGFNFAILDDKSNLVFASDSASNTVTRTFGAYTSHILMRGASNATVTWVDSWPAKTDPLSYGASYSFSEVAGDTARIHFKGESFKWYATVPEDKTGGNVTVSIRNKDSNGQWTSFTDLSTFKLPDNITNEVVYEISYESAQLASDTVYQIRITNNDGNFVSIDSIEGYWSASLVEYNEDSLRISVSRPERFKQIYDKRFSGGSMYKIEEPAYTGFRFTGDRLIILSAKGRNYGTARLLIKDLTLGYIYDGGTANHVMIPGGESDGSLRVDLDTGKRGNEITQYVLFDSNDYFTDGLPWGLYSVHFFLYGQDVETYNAPVEDVEFDSFVPRCKDCTPASGETVTVNKPIFLDGIFVHEVVGLSVAFDLEWHLEILKSTTEAIQVEWDVTDTGLRVEPRLGQDTNEYLREGENTLVSWDITNDISEMATMLISHGADIDGLPLFAITEDKETRARLGRTVQREHDFRNVADYLQLIGLSRAELRRRSYPSKRIQVTHIADHLGLEAGDSFLLWTEKMGTIRVRIQRVEINESSGRTYAMECITWPRIN